MRRRLTIAPDVEQLNNANHSIQRAEVTRRYAEFRGELRAWWGSLALGVMVALTAVIRLRIVERRVENERAVAEEAERQMRQLSQQLVATQEEERKNLSRELHDHVGQMLTALRMELGRIHCLRVIGPSLRRFPCGFVEGSPRRRFARSRTRPRRRGWCRRRVPAARRQHGPHGS